MAAKFRISGGESGAVAHVVEHSEGRLEPGLLTYTHPVDHYQYAIQPLASPEKGVNMATNPATPTTTLIHNGTDTVGWTAAAVTGGGFVFDSTAQAFDGTRSIDATVSANNDIAGFTAPAPINPTGFSALTFAMYITAFPTSGTKDVTFQWFDGGTPVGNELSIKPYVNTLTFNSWQTANIPLSDFGLTGAVQVDELRIKTVDSGRGDPPDYYLDAINLASSGASGVDTYSFTPNYGEDYSLLKLRITAYNTSKTDANPTEFFGLPALTGGFELILRNKSRVFLSLIARDVWDLLRAPNAEIRTNADGSTGATFIVDFPIPLEHMQVEGTTGTFVEVRIKDDLSGLARLETSLHLARLEDR